MPLLCNGLTLTDPPMEKETPLLSGMNHLEEFQKPDRPPAV